MDGYRSGIPVTIRTARSDNISALSSSASSMLGFGLERKIEIDATKPRLPLKARGFVD